MIKLLFIAILYFSSGYSYFPGSWITGDALHNSDPWDDDYPHEKEIKEINDLYKKILEILSDINSKYSYQTQAFLPLNLHYIKWSQSWGFTEFEREWSLKDCYWSDYIDRCTKIKTTKGPIIKEYDNYKVDSSFAMIDQMKNDFNLLVRQYISVHEEDYNKLNEKGQHWRGHLLDSPIDACIERNIRVLGDLRNLANPNSKENKYFDRLKELQYKVLYDCAYNCKNVYALWNLGLLQFSDGNLFDCLEVLKPLVDQYLNQRDDIFLDEISQFCTARGEVSRELGLYQEAVSALTEAIKQDPENKEAYFSRASCYFEMGDYEKSIKDFINSGFSSNKINSEDFDSLHFSTGLIKGTSYAALASLEDFLPSVYSSISGITNGLWAFVNSPVDCSIEMIDACKAIASLVSDNSAYENLRLLIPEIGQLAENWEKSSSFEKGELLGNIIGKYGTDIFLTGASIKTLKAYRNLRKANDLMTLEGMAKAIKKDKLLDLSKNWQNQTKNAIESIKKDISGRDLYLKLRDITDENQLRKSLHKYGIETFARPKGVPKDWKISVSKNGKGMKYIHPENNQTYIRVMPADLNSPYPHKKIPHVSNMKNGEYLDKSGNIVNRKAPEAHIDYSEFIFRDN